MNIEAFSKRIASVVAGSRHESKILTAGKNGDLMEVLYVADEALMESRSVVDALSRELSWCARQLCNEASL